MALNVSNTEKLTSQTATGGLQTSTTVLASTKGRTSFMIQNQSTAPLFIAFGTTASSTIYHLVLKGGTGAADGSGGSIAEENGIVFSGVITCYASGTPSYTVTETADS